MHPLGFVQTCLLTKISYVGIVREWYFEGNLLGFYFGKTIVKGEFILIVSHRHNSLAPKLICFIIYTVYI